MLRTVRLSGELGVKYGKEHRFDVSTPAEAIRALSANFPQFKKDLASSHERNVGYQIINGKCELENENQVNEPASGEIVIVPVIMGASAGTRILVGAVIIAVAATLDILSVGATAPITPYMYGIGISLVLGGVIELLSPVPKIKAPEERGDNKPSYLFNGPVNTTNQGHPVPIGYGRVLVGGGIVSAGISIDQIMAGYRRVQTPATVIVTAASSESNYLSSPPAGWYRRELVSFQKADSSGPGSPPYDIWYWRFYYYVTTLELIET